MATKFHSIFLLSIYVFSLTFTSCKKEELPPEEENNIIDSRFTLSTFTLSTGADSTNSLAAKIVDNQENVEMFYFGGFDPAGNPESLNSVAVKKSSSNDIVNILFDDSNRPAFLYVTNSGQKDSTLIKYEFYDDTTFLISVFKYNWDTNTDSLLFEADVVYTNGEYEINTLFNRSIEKESGLIKFLKEKRNNKSLKGGVTFGDVLAFTGISVGVAVGIAFSGVVGVVVYVATASTGLAVAAGVASICAWITPVNAAENPIPNDNINTPTNPSNSIPNPISTNPCSGINLTFNVTMDSFGSIMFSNPQGGFNYTYSFEYSPFQQNPIFNGPYDPGSYIVSLRSGDGCVKTEVRNIQQSPPLAVGDLYQGGIIAYIYQPGDPGYDPAIQHGIIASTADQNQSIEYVIGGFPNINIPQLTSTALGSGTNNTNIIVNSYGIGNYAATSCSDLVLGGYSDWVLPSLEDLNKLFLNRIIIGGFAQTVYWSSSENTSFDQPFGQDFQNGNQTNYAANLIFAVRAVRYF